MSKKLVFLDIDGTLLDERYHSNDSTLKQTIIQLQASGVTFCLNSNRSLEDLLPIARRFAIEGLLIGENGIFAYDTKSQQTRYFVEPSHLSKFVEQKKIYEDIVLKTLERQFGKQVVSWLDTDTVAALSHNLTDTIDAQETILALNNVFRRYTSSIHILHKHSDTLNHFSAEDLELLTNRVIEAAGPSRKMFVAFSTNFSNILLTPKETSKRKAVKTLLGESTYLKEDVYAIGDEYGDYEMIKGIGSFFTVCNADSKTKQSSQQVSKRSYAKGVNELLQVLL